MIGALSTPVRAVAGLAPLVRLAPRPDARPMGVSALVRVKDEEDWVEASLRSLEGFADEIIVIDNGSTDSTLDRVLALGPTLAAELRAEAAPALDHAALSNAVLARARFRWVIRWDADFVAHTSGPNALRRLRAVLAAFPPWRHACVHPALVELAGDLRHQFPDLKVRYDSHVLTYSPRLKYRTRRVREAGRARPIAVESLRLPPWYAIGRWETPAIFHVNVKPARRLLLRHFWQEWWAERPGCSLEDYAAARTAAEWGASSLDAAARAFVARYCGRLVPFDPAPYGGYPELLAPALASPRYRVLHRDGRVVGRSDALEDGAAPRAGSA